MYVRMGVVLLALCSAGITKGEEVSSVYLQQLRRGQVVEVQTLDRFYRIEVVDRSTGEALVSASWDGANYTAPRKVFVLGSTHGRQANSGGLTMVVMHQLRTGMAMELSIETLDDKNRRLTAPVRSINLSGNQLAANF